MVLEKNYSIMCAEVLEILKYCPESDINKIPKQLIKSLESNKKVGVNVIINPNKGIFEQNITNETIIMMFIIMRNYWATAEEKLEIDKILEENELKYKELYSIDNLFKNNTINTQNETNDENLEINEKPKEKEEKSLIEYHETIITKFLKIIKKFFSHL